MIEKIKSYFHHFPWQSLTDLRTLGQIGFVIIVLLVSWSGVKTIQSNYELQKQIATITKQNQVSELENQNQQLQNQYYSSNQYLELSARQNLGLGLPGETELIVPKNVALAHLANISAAPAQQGSTKSQPFYQKNFTAWINFMLHRQSTSN